MPHNVIENLKDKVEILEKILDEKIFFTGDLATIADVSLGASIPTLKFLCPSLVSHRLQAWFDRLQRDIPELEEINDQVDYRKYLKK